MQHSIERFPRKNYSPLKAVSIARTVEEQQKDFENLLLVAGRELGRRATIRTISSTRITLLESSGVHKAFKKAKGYNNKAVQKFCHYLKTQLENNTYHKLEVEVDQHHPLGFYGLHSDKLGVNIVEDDRLASEREKIEKILLGEFGHIPKLRPLHPHITIGSAKMNLLTEEQKSEPRLIIPPEVIPETIMINGLSVFLDNESLSKV